MRRPFPTSSRAGFSLLELMVTMGLATLLLGVGAGVYVKMGRRTAAVQAMASVNQLVVRAKNASAKAPATIVPDATDGLIHAYTEEVLQELHFESRPTDSGDYVPLGIEGRDCRLVGAVVEADRGRVGGGLRVDGGSIDCGSFAAYDVDEGIHAEVWLQPATLPRCDVVSKGATILVRLESSTAGSRVSVRLSLQDPGGGAQERVERAVSIPHVRPGTWIGIRVSYDRSEILTATSEGHGFVVRDRWKETRRLAVDRDASLLVAAGFQGWVDDVRIGGMRSAEPLELPPTVRLFGANPPIRFVDGRLDPTLPAPAKLSLVHEGVVSTFEIGPNGTVLAVRQTEAPVTDAAPAKPPEKE